MDDDFEEYDSELEREAEEYALLEKSTDLPQGVSQTSNHRVEIQPDSGEQMISSTSSIPQRNYDAQGCDLCGNLSLDHKLHNIYGESICTDCKKSDVKYKNITKGKAKEEYLLTDDDIAHLRYMSLSNPQRPGWSSMKLYLVKQIVEVATERWGNLDNIEQERKRRRDENLKRRRANASKLTVQSLQTDNSNSLMHNIKRLKRELGGNGAEEPNDKEHTSSKSRDKTSRKSKKHKRPIAVESLHVHTFGDPVSLKDGDWFMKTCVECGFEVKYESI